MILTKNISYARALVKARLFKRRFPFAVAWHLTYRCNYNCRYCGIPSKAALQEELPLEQVLLAIDGLKGMGTKRIHFCGGECLLRQDFAEVLGYCRKKDIQTGLISNGALVPEHIEKLKTLQILKLSFDGPEHIQDELRGKNAYHHVMEAVFTAKRAGINVIFNTTLTKKNIPELDFILKKSKELNVPVKFSPLNYVHSENKEIQDLLPDRNTIRNAVAALKKNKRLIQNSVAGLDYIADYPECRTIKPCVASRFFCVIKPNADMYPCERMNISNPPNYKIQGIAKAFYALPLVNCSRCWCTSTLELNFIYNFDLRALFNALTQNV